MLKHDARMSSHSFPLVYVIKAVFYAGLQLGGLNPGLKTDGLKGIGQQQPTSLGLGLG